MNEYIGVDLGGTNFKACCSLISHYNIGRAY